MHVPEQFQVAVDVITSRLADRRDARLSDLFDPEFRANFSTEETVQVLDGMVRRWGRCREFELLALSDETQMEGRWHFEDGVYVDGTIGINGQSGLVCGLHFGLAGRLEDSWSQLLEDVSECAVEVSFAVGGVDSEPMASLDPDRRLCVGSASKLVLFGSLLELIRRGGRQWTDLVTLREDDRSLPSGVMQVWPAGSSLTLEACAILLLSHSDNTAADMLHREVGREAIDRWLRSAGVSCDISVRPFPSTRALFGLISGPDPRVEDFLGAGAEARLAMLEEAARRVPNVARVERPWPRGIGWYFSAKELRQILSAVRLGLARDAWAKEILETTRPGFLAKGWNYVAFKGGQSPGRLTLAALFANRDDQYLSAVLACNNGDRTPDTTQCSTLLKRAGQLARSAL